MFKFYPSALSTRLKRIGQRLEGGRSTSVRNGMDVRERFSTDGNGSEVLLERFLGNIYGPYWFSNAGAVKRERLNGSIGALVAESAELGAVGSEVDVEHDVFCFTITSEEEALEVRVSRSLPLASAFWFTREDASRGSGGWVARHDGATSDGTLYSRLLRLLAVSGIILLSEQVLRSPLKSLGEEFADCSNVYDLLFGDGEWDPWEFYDGQYLEDSRHVPLGQHRASSPSLGGTRALSEGPGPFRVRASSRASCRSLPVSAGIGVVRLGMAVRGLCGRCARCRLAVCVVTVCACPVG